MVVDSLFSLAQLKSVVENTPGSLLSKRQDWEGRRHCETRKRLANFTF